MRILVLHSEDQPGSGHWSQEPWDRVVDLGFAGPETYSRWSHLFRCSVQPLPRLPIEELGLVRQTLAPGVGHMPDEQGFDWWDLISIGFYEQIEQILALEKFLESCAADDEIVVSRDGFHARAIGLLFRGRVSCVARGDSVVQRLRSSVSRALGLGPRRVLEIAGDKYDADYRFRSRFTQRVASRSVPVVLLPTAYGNASRTALSYAGSLPEQDFLLITTRQSGWVKNPPKNVGVTKLAAYAAAEGSDRELRMLMKRWHGLLTDATRNPIFSVLHRLGVLDSVPALLRSGLAIRDAWVRVFDDEPIASVLCSDEMNPYTRLPLMIARTRGLPAIACHHGALDVRYRFRENSGDMVLSKSQMEWDYLVNFCGVTEDRVEIAGPPRETPAENFGKQEKSIVFFSEPYELTGGRCGEFYAEVLPRLAEIARSRDFLLVLKLHPYERRPERKRMALAALTPDQRRNLRVVDGALRNELLRETWFAVTVASTTAVDCMLCGIPAFLCTWLTSFNYGYPEQFIKFGAAIGLSCADEIPRIPELIERRRTGDSRDLWTAASPQHLRKLLLDRSIGKVARDPAEKIWA